MTNREMNKEKILEALKTIQRVCENHQCDTCPFTGYDDVCIIQARAPIDWVIGDEGTHWRAFSNW